MERWSGVCRAIVWLFLTQRRQIGCYPRASHAKSIQALLKKDARCLRGTQMRQTKDLLLCPSLLRTAFQATPRNKLLATSQLLA